MSRLAYAAPQFLVDDLKVSLDYYTKKLGFTVDFVYEGFYASVSRGGARIHLKCAPKLAAEREHRKANEHLDAYVDVTDVETLFESLKSSGATITKPLESRPWGTRDFYVEDPDGYVICFSQSPAE